MSRLILRFFQMFIRKKGVDIMTIGERVKDLCEKNGITANKVENDLKFGIGYISKLDKSNPNVKKIKSIADYFNVSVDYLLASENYEYDKNDNVWNYHVSKHDQDLIARIMLDPDLSKRLIAYAEKLAEILDEEEIEINRKKGD